MFLATREELRPIRPLPKFVVVKIIVFASFWQSVAIAILASAGIIKPSVRPQLAAQEAACVSLISAQAHSKTHLASCAAEHACIWHT